MPLCRNLQSFIIFVTLMNFIEKYSRKKLRRQAARVNRRIVLVSPAQAKKVGILWHEDDVKAFNFLQEYFRSQSAIVRHLCYSEAKTTADSNTLIRKDTDWLGFPKGGAYETFISTEFDLLLNVSVRPSYPLEVITALSAASFKIGWDYNQSGFYDLSVDVSHQPDSLYLAEQQIFYLQSFNNKP